MANSVTKWLRRSLKVISVNSVDVVARAAGHPDTSSMLGKAKTVAGNKTASAANKNAKAQALLEAAKIDSGVAAEINEAVAEIEAAKGK